MEMMLSSGFCEMTQNEMLVVDGGVSTEAIANGFVATAGLVVGYAVGTWVGATIGGPIGAKLGGEVGEKIGIIVGNVVGGYIGGEITMSVINVIAEN